MSELTPFLLPLPSWPPVPSNRRAQPASGTRAQDLGDILSLRKLCSRQELLKVINSSSGSPCWERRKHVSNTPGRGVFRGTDNPPPQGPTRLQGILQPLEREVTPHPEGVWERRLRSRPPTRVPRGWPGCPGMWGRCGKASGLGGLAPTCPSPPPAPHSAAQHGNPRAQRSLGARPHYPQQTRAGWVGVGWGRVSLE